MRALLEPPSSRGVGSSVANAESLVGQKIIVVANLQPRRLRGLESHGMLLAPDVDGRPVLATIPSETSNGARLR